MSPVEDELRLALGTLTDPPARLTTLIHELPRTRPHGLRRRHGRRLLVAGAAVATAVVALVVTLVAVPHASPGVGAAHRPHSQGGAAEVVGRPVRTGVAYEGGRMYVWLGRDTDGRLMISAGRMVHGLPVGSSMNRRDLGGAATAERCGARTPGFHCTYDGGGLGSDPHSWLLIGYVVGDVASVHVTVDGHPHRAGVAAWSVDPSVHLWWMAGPILDHYPRGDTGTATALIAQDAAGRVVARSDGAVSHG